MSETTGQNDQMPEILLPPGARMDAPKGRKTEKVKMDDGEYWRIPSKVPVPDGDGGSNIEDGYVMMKADAFNNPEDMPPADPLMAAVGDLQKSAGSSPVGQPYKVMESMYWANMYSGIQQPNAATGMTFDFLRRMSERNPVVTAIIRTRQNQVAAFAKLPMDRFDSGFAIRLRNPREHASEKAQKRMQEIENAILRSGYEEKSAEGEKADSFGKFIRTLVRDSLTIDQACFRIEHGKNKEKFPAVWWKAVDGARIRLVDPEVYKPIIDPSLGKRVGYVEMHDTAIVREYAEDGLGMMIRNPRSDWWTNGYGESELERLTGVVASTLFAMDFNRTWFSRNHLPPGILGIIGNYSDEVLEAFRLQWMGMMGSPNRYWQTPILAMREGRQIEWISLRDNQRQDMYWSRWIEFLVVVTCSVYQINPEEIAFTSWSGGKPAISMPSPESRVVQGEDKGLRPLLAALAEMMNENIVWKIDPDFTFQWVGLNVGDRQAEQQLLSGWMNSGIYTIGDVRDMLDVKRTNESYEDAPLHGLAYQVWFREKFGEEGQPQEGFGEGGEEGEEEEETPENLSREQIAQILQSQNDDDDEEDEMPRRKKNEDSQEQEKSAASRTIDITVK